MARNEPTWEEAIEQVLRVAGNPLHYAEISEKILAEKIKTTPGATPSQTVVARLSSSLKQDGTPFVRLGGGFYGLRAIAENAPPSEATAEAAEPEETGAVRAFGMFWRREDVDWAPKKQQRLLGSQGSGALQVNFAAQVGVYLLHDRDRVVYVGRAADTLFARLQAHTVDRLQGRWDRFSWFGLKNVAADGALGEPSSAWTHKVVIDTMEALLIESMEPPLNRKRGDNFSAAEYLQVIDHRLENARLLAAVQRKIDATP